jgi:hypothetical protein
LKSNRGHEAFTETATLRFTSVGPNQVAPDFLRHITFHFTFVNI